MFEIEKQELLRLQKQANKRLNDPDLDYLDYTYVIISRHQVSCLIKSQALMERINDLIKRQEDDKRLGPGTPLWNSDRVLEFLTNGTPF